MAMLNESTFEDQYLDFRILRSSQALAKYIIKCFSKPQNSPCGFIWQMKGNNLVGDIRKIVEDFGDDTELIEVFRNSDVDAIIDGDLGDRLYSVSDESEELKADKSHGILLFVEYTGANEDVRNLAENIIGSGKFALPSGWRVMFTGNVEAGEYFWENGFEKKYNNVEYDPKTETTEDSMDESYTENVHMDRADMIFNVLSGVYQKGEINEDDYIYMDTNSITVGTMEEMISKDLLFKSRPAKEFIDFDNGSFDFELLSLYIDEKF